MPGTKGSRKRPLRNGKPFKRSHKLFKGNQFTNQAKTDEEPAQLEAEITGASCSKIRRTEDFSVSEDPQIHYVIVSWLCVFGRLS